mmetsp:Transcript_25924/g.41643  ORF Transcript_25924/g.41643 Transcript_25924/m.41643 type:complete len:113 (-) Transcript_25924:220-558(-)
MLSLDRERQLRSSLPISGLPLDGGCQLISLQLIRDCGSDGNDGGNDDVELEILGITPSLVSLSNGVEEEVEEDEVVDLEASLASLPRHSRNVRTAILKAGGYRGCSEGAHLI